MHVQQTSVQGEDFIGLLGMCSDRYAILSKKFPKIEALDTPVIKTTLYGTNLIGLFCAGNSNSLLLPYFISDEEATLLEKKLKENDVDTTIGRLKDKSTALGNLIACNDKAALVSPMISDIKGVRDILGVEVVQGGIAGHEEVGACCVATNKGFLVHPDAGSELMELASIFRVEGLTGSVNFGFPFVKSGLIANSNGYVTGSRTTGIELGRIDEALGFMD
ncbi:MAG: translation initiation factor IF-6 [Candidatus Altiarchaeota archaeon]|nr:translation initiation factor IF-6 [Candidatus Altiarchaeota archaeon]